MSMAKSKPMKIYHWFQEPQFYLVAFIYMAARLFVNVSQSYITFYVQYTMELPSEMIAIIPLVMYISGFFISFVLQYVTEKVGYKIAFVSSCFVGLGKLTFLYTIIFESTNSKWHSKCNISL